MKKKSIAALVAVALLLGCALGGTLAWLTDKTQEVKNVFTTSDIGVTLTETDPDTQQPTTTGGNYKMVPGWKIDKDPKVTVLAGSEDCYLFVKVNKTGGDVTINSTSYSFDDFIAYAVDEYEEINNETGWHKLNNVDGVYYREVTDISDNKEYKILAGGSYTSNQVNYTWNDNQVLTKPEVTKEMMNAVEKEGNKPTLTFTAYASQLYKNNTDKFTAAEAWGNVNGGSTTNP